MKDSSFKSLYQILSTALNESPSPICWIVDENISTNLLEALQPTLEKRKEAITAITNRFDLKHLLSKKYHIETIISDFDLSSIDSPKHFNTIIYRISKEKPLAHHCINESIKKLSKNGELILIGEKNDGFKSIVKNTCDHFEIEKNSKKTGSYYSANLEKTSNTTNENIVNNSLNTQDYKNLRLIEDDGISFYSKPGVFGWNKVDRGSKLLAEYITHHHHQFRKASSFLDLGCGWGYFSLVTKDFETEYRCATDNNIAAVNATQKNMELNGLDVDVLLDDCGSNIERRFKLIVCNPPFHSGFGVDEELSKKFLKQTSRLLNKRGTALFVVNQFIPIERLGEKLFGKIQLVQQDQGFKIFLIEH
ncbi:MAG: methyltransferase [Cellvibrionaceae bacterium]